MQPTHGNAPRPGDRTAPAPRIDAHCHLWTLSRGDYGWLDPSDPALTPIARDYGLDDLASAAPEADGVVLVQAAPTVAETEFLLDLKADQVAGVVGWVDLSDASVPAEIDRLATRGLTGLRPMLQDLPDPDWIATAPRAGALDAMEAHNLRFDALVTPVHLDALARFLHARPDLPAIIDHAAKPALSAPADDPRHALWRDGMRRCAEAGAWCKLSGLLTEMSPQDRVDPLARLSDLLGDLLDWFGPGRLVWGSDWPVVTLAAPRAAWTALTDRLLAPLPTFDRAAILGGNAARFYGVAA